MTSDELLLTLITSDDLPHQVARLHEEAYKDPIQKVLEAFEQCDEEQRAEALYVHLYHHEAAPKCSPRRHRPNLLWTSALHACAHHGALDPLPTGA
jgi:hypothetical protein